MLWLIVGTFSTIGIYLWLRKQSLNSPPGPYSFPFIGHKHKFIEYAKKGGIQRLLMHWKKKYGPIMAVNFGTYKAVILGDFNVAREAFQLHQLTGRVQGPKIKLRSSYGRGGPMRGVMFTEGRSWTEQRQFMMKHLKKYTRERLEGTILLEGEELITRFNQSNGLPLTTRHLLTPPITNIIRTIVANQRFPHGDPNLNKVMDAISERVQNKGLGTLLNYLPQWFVEIFPEATGWNRFKQTLEVPTKYIENMVKETLEREEGLKDDFIHAFTANMNTTTDVESSFYGEAGNENLVHVILDFFDAGVETTSTTLTWILLFLALHPAIQTKLAQEIHDVVGDASPSLEDRQRMPYTEAVLQEALRKSSTAPLAIFHRALDTVTVGSTLIPKDTILISNIYGIHHDQEVWGKTADEFDPERFLSGDHGSFVQSKQTLPFGTGKRICPGENIARSALFLLSVLTVQHFNMTCDPESTIPSMDQEVGGIIAPPKPHKLIFTQRLY